MATRLVATKTTDMCRPMKRPQYSLVLSLTKYNKNHWPLIILISNCQVVRCQGNYLSCFQLVTFYTSSIFYYSHIMVCCFSHHLPVKLAKFINSNHSMETHLIFFFLSPNFQEIRLFLLTGSDDEKIKWRTVVLLISVFFFVRASFF